MVPPQGESYVMVRCTGWAMDAFTGQVTEMTPVNAAGRPAAPVTLAGGAVLYVLTSGRLPRDFRAAPGDAPGPAAPVTSSPAVTSGSGDTTGGFTARDVRRARDAVLGRDAEAAFSAAREQQRACIARVDATDSTGRDVVLDVVVPRPWRGGRPGMGVEGQGSGE